MQIMEISKVSKFLRKKEGEVKLCPEEMAPDLLLDAVREVVG